MPPVQSLLLIGSALFCVGLYGVLTRRHAIAILLSIELVLNASILNFVVVGRVQHAVQAQAFAVFVIALAACEGAVGLAIILGLYRTAKTAFADDVNLLKG